MQAVPAAGCPTPPARCELAPQVKLKLNALQSAGPALIGQAGQFRIAQPAAAPQRVASGMWLAAAPARPGHHGPPGRRPVTASAGAGRPQKQRRLRRLAQELGKDPKSLGVLGVATTVQGISEAAKLVQVRPDHRPNAPQRCVGGLRRLAGGPAGGRRTSPPPHCAGADRHRPKGPAAQGAPQPPAVRASPWPAEPPSG